MRIRQQAMRVKGQGLRFKSEAGFETADLY
jgi:hypothetical protein